MARQLSVTGNIGDARRSEAILRLCRRAVEVDPDYARPWALMADAQLSLRIMIGRDGDDGLAAAERAIALDPNLAEAHAARAHALTRAGRHAEAWPEIEAALRLDPESYHVNGAAAEWHHSQRRFAEAIPYWEKAVAIMDTDYANAGMLVSCYKAIGDADNARRAAQRALARAEKVVAQDPHNGSAMSYVVSALAALGEVERAQEWIERATLLDPDNLNMRFNFACTLVLELHEFDAALDLLEPMLKTVRIEALNWTKADPDFDLIRDHPRFRAMIAAAEARLAAGA
jgi:adenylate cyclase